MSSHLGSKPVIAIVGQTATGKSALGMSMAVKYGGEIIAADSRTVYKGMNIGTAKPTKADRSEITHHCLDIISPQQTFSAAEFQRLAREAIDEISSRGHIPFIVGGSGLYIDGLLYDFDFADQPHPSFRKELEGLNLEDLQKKALSIGIMPEEVNFRNARHLSRIIERGRQVGGRKVLPGNVLLLGIEVEKSELHARIERRIADMMKLGLINEVQKLREMYGKDIPGLLAPGYRAIGMYLDQSCTLDEAKNMFITNDKKLAKRQKTWFKRNKDIRWVQTEQQADKLIADFLSKFDTITS